MTVHVLIPVFNRLEMTRHVLECLRNQELDEHLHVIVIDDGSSDGTAEYLNSLGDRNLEVLKGDGSLWWGGAIDRGLKHLFASGEDDGWVLMVNNDTSFDASFVQDLLDIARENAPAAVGSIICDENQPDRVLSIGARTDTWRLKVLDKLAAVRLRNPDSPCHDVDALSGRGTLYPMAALRKVHGMRPRLLPHYLADYELAARVRRAGYRLIVSEGAVVLSEDEYGSGRTFTSQWARLFSVRSPHYLPAVLAFWWSTSSPFERLTLVPRLVYAAVLSTKAKE